MFPSSRTAMMSAFLMVDSLCAITSTVRPWLTLSRVAWTTCSEAVSRALVASSRIKTCGFFTRARAIAIRCFCPPETVTPRSPSTVSYCFGKEVMKSWAFACLAAS
uniref:Putative transposase is481 family n=1 Tax=Ixodes ricinus TaxID=34613 RepID=A0A147BU43_IXORI